MDLTRKFLFIWSSGGSTVNLNPTPPRLALDLSEEEEPGVSKPCLRAEQWWTLPGNLWGGIHWPLRAWDENKQNPSLSQQCLLGKGFHSECQKLHFFLGISDTKSLIPQGNCVLGRLQWLSHWGDERYPTCFCLCFSDYSYFSRNK